MTTLLKERSATLSLAAIMSFRMLGLFMILPVFVVQAHNLYHASAQLIGIALGIYGFTQACLQMPFGMLSDRIGRKPVITLGLLLFAGGSIIAALSHNMGLLIFARACQGAGAIGSTVLALLADLTRDENRSKAMAFIGLAIGCSFSIAMILGPIINAWFHLAGIFWCTAGLALAGLLLLHFAVPTPPHILHRDAETEPAQLRSVLKNPQLLRLNSGIFTLHAVLTAVFIAIPILLSKHFHLTELKQTIFYLLVLLFSFLLMLPFIIFAEKKRQMKAVFIAAISLLLLSQLLLLWLNPTVILLGLSLLIFFTAFNLLEATLPSWVSKVTPIRRKGTAMGVYSTAQFLGIFCGGVVGGWAYGHYEMTGVFMFTSLLLLLWLVLSLSLEQPPYLSTIILQLHQFNEQSPQLLHHQLSQIPSIAEVAIMPAEGLVYLKIRQAQMTKDELPKQLERSNLLRRQINDMAIS